MPTALAHIYSEEGFVIAGDGNHHFRVSPNERRLISDHVQKILHLPGADREVVCSFFGRVTLANDADERVFNFVSACCDAAEKTASQTVETADEWGELIGPHIVESLSSVKQRGELSHDPSPVSAESGKLGRTLISVFVDGYVCEEPSRTEIRFYHRHQDFDWQVGGSHDLSAWRKSRFYGSPRVEDLLFKTDDSRFDKYRNEACRRVAKRHVSNPAITIRLSDAVDAARSFIQACCDPMAREIERDDYQRIGGQLQLATITPADGFQWVERPEVFDQL
ncbi:MAG TPA: hypothetical protein VHU83_14945 [Bryobacteraceae bacterium]|jgi:hypothetical protein|nr:hypothetical protein [Bryobacteraceae bacterium]